MTLATPSSSDACEEQFALRRGVSNAVLPGGGLHLVAWPHAEHLGRLTSGQHAVLRALAVRAHTRAELAALATGDTGDTGDTGVTGDTGDTHSEKAGSDAVAHLLDRLRAGGWLKVIVARPGQRRRDHGVAAPGVPPGSPGQPLYTLDPLRPPPPPQEPESRAALTLSRFAVLHQDDEGLVLESPRAWCDIRIHDPALLGALGRLGGDHATPLGTPASAGGPVAAEAGRRLVDDLYWAGMAVPVGSEDGELRLRQWNPYDLWFHDRTRLGYRGFLGDRFAATFWAKDRFDPLPARPEPYPGPAVDLHRPDLDALRRTDPPLTAAIEDRRSIRDHDESNPVTAAQLGEFLYRCARTRSDGLVWDGLEITSRPYPAGGGVYELEVYPVVRLAAGVAPGMYHYDSHAHQLRLVREVSHPAVRHLLRASAPGGNRPPQVLLAVSARPGRLMWKYEAIGYRLVLAHLGVLYQTMYLVATAMGLAPCAIGAGDAVAFTEATGHDPLEECGVGEFALGSALEPTPTASTPPGGGTG